MNSFYYTYCIIIILPLSNFFIFFGETKTRTALKHILHSQFIQTKSKKETYVSKAFECENEHGK